MAFAITQSCCVDASCVSACPVNCIHPAPGEPDFGSTDMLFVDPRACIDCGACAEVCPVDAVFPVEELVGPLRDYAEVNAGYYAGRDVPTALAGSPLFHAWDPVRFDRVLPADFPRLDVAVVGSGPAAMYAVEDLLLHTTAHVTIIDRLTEPGGLVRFGVAPDHASTKKVGEHFARYHAHHRVKLRLGVEVGRDVTADELARRYDAVIYAVGAAESRDLGIPGEDLRGNLASTTVVGWYNGHPEIPADAVDLSGPRVVVVGTGNVSLDIARVLAADPSALSGVAPGALAALRGSAVREVVVLGRRGPRDAAWTRGELLGLLRRDDLEVVVDDHDPRVADEIAGADTAGTASLLRDVPLLSEAGEPSRRRVVLRFHAALEDIVGTDHVTGVRLVGGDVVEAGVVVRAIGHRGRPVPGLPFDPSSGTVPHVQGRVQDRPGTYVVGWIKRGASGGIGANRADAAETVASLIADGATGVLGDGASRNPVTRVLGRLTRR
ncbi:FAD-dependent oxidoreductase [Actinomycetospora sp. NBRC 106378]|uniref:FAD-dependent oxidoreductase n=1 Tax=Actinomycetospora sp. NBRC 106378 TaxID=3032208 RepID=UPI0024A47805|nr:FAD-dependent oxidoreductase [Actinomycetospora sp. NBRC 106378]GLZ54992.1 ferredoxin--NADP(+) reductase [Actinomycetospora sp. NBRC 106378]